METISRQGGKSEVVIQTVGKTGLTVQEVSDGKLGSRPALSPVNQNFLHLKHSHDFTSLK